MTKKRPCSKVQVNNSITVMFIHSLISSGCTFICDMSYSHDKDIVDFFEIFLKKIATTCKLRKQFTKESYNKIADK